jgi:hypothetical protein
MKLKEFVTQTIVQIVDEGQEAQEQLGEGAAPLARTVLIASVDREPTLQCRRVAGL